MARIKPLTFAYLKARQELWDAALMGSDIGFLLTQQQWADLHHDVDFTCERGTLLLDNRGMMDPRDFTGISWHTLELCQYSDWSPSPPKADCQEPGLTGWWAYLRVRARELCALTDRRIGFWLDARQYEALYEDPAFPEDKEWEYDTTVCVVGGIALTCEPQSLASSADILWNTVDTLAVGDWIAEPKHLREVHVALDGLDNAAATARTAREAEKEAEGDRLMAAVRAVSRSSW